MQPLTPAHAQFFLIRIELDALYKYQMTVEQYFSSNAKLAEARLDFANVDEHGEFSEPDPIHVDKLQDDYWEFQDKFPNHFRASFLSQMVSFIENNLTRLAVRYHSYTTPNFREDSNYVPELLQEKDLKKVISYLKNTAGVDAERLKTEWDLITGLKKLRNLFLHHNGVLTKRNKYYQAIITFISKNPELAEVYIPHLHDKETLGITLKQDLNWKLIDLTRTFFFKLLDDNLKLILPGQQEIK
jgi:hypothetical protein